MNPQAVPRRTKSADKSGALQTLRARGRVNGPRGSVWSACVFSAAFPRQTEIRWPGRFMESPIGFCGVHWDDEPRQRVGRGVLTSPRLGGLETRPTVWFMEREVAS